MICSKCGKNKPNYHFVLFKNKIDKSFFVNPDANSNQCWECSGPYRCIICEEVKEASQFRVGGRVCKDCKLPSQNKILRLKERRL